MSVYLRMPTYEKRPLVKGIVFYGRRYSARLLNCYLERNMLKSGGLFSEVRRKLSAMAESDMEDCAPHHGHSQKQSFSGVAVGSQCSTLSRLYIRADAVHGRFCLW